ncbi:MAG: polysaccharide pyruvyl transferase CsaB [bacterium]
MPQNFFVIGYFGCRNAGDDAILQSFVEWCRNKIPSVKITALSANPLGTEKNYGVGAVGKKQFFALLRTAASCDAVIFPGGSILQDITSLRSLMYYAGLVWCARLLRKRIFFLNQGVGPLRRTISLKITQRCASRWAQLFTVRDEDSLDLLRKTGVPHEKLFKAADITLMLKSHIPDLPVKTTDKKNDNRKKIGISLRPHAGLHNLTPRIAAALSKSASEPIEIHIIPLHEKEDAAPSINLLEKIKELHPELPVRCLTLKIDSRFKTQDSELSSTPLEILASIRELDLMIGMRLHSLVFSGICGVPFLGLSYDPKVKAFCEATSQPCLDLADDITGEEIATELNNVLQNANFFKEKLKSEIEEQYKALNCGMDIFLGKVTGEEIKFEVLGIPVSPLNFREVVSLLEGKIQSRESCHVVTLNPEMVMVSRTDEVFRKIITAADVIVPDGVGIRLAVRAKYGRKLGKTTGIELAEYFFSISRRKGIRIFMLGAKPAVIERCVAEFSRWTGPPIIAGYHHGYMRTEAEEKEAAAGINRSGADILFVGMGAPLQEKWIAKYRETLNVPVMIGVGGCFDVFSGTVQRAPGIFRALGLEWLHRIISQPRRIKRAAALPAFALLAVCDALRYRVKSIL